VEVLKVDPEKPEEAVLLAAAETVMRGGVIAFPTDTMYGLGCSLFDVSAVEMVARLKRRDPSLAVISLIPEPRQAYGLAVEIHPVAERLIERHWPGPLSLIFRAARIVPARVQGAGGTVALRCPKDTLSQRLLDRIGGPVVSSSANLSGQRPAETAEEVVRIFGNQLDLVIDGGPRHGGLSSTLVDVSEARAPAATRRARRHRRPQGLRGHDRPCGLARQRSARCSDGARARRLCFRSMQSPVLRVLFLCTGNTCRSPMAAGVLRMELGEEGARVDTSSAGTAARKASQTPGDGPRPADGWT
jgi:L-threonylcarbamoyladenylate synthase